MNAPVRTHQVITLNWQFNTGISGWSINLKKPTANRPFNIFMQEYF